MTRNVKQNGAVLVIALIILIVITLLSITTMSTGILELRMSSNEEQRMAAFQMAQAGLDRTTERADYFRVIGTPGSGAINCSTGVTGCSQNSVTFSGDVFDVDNDGDVDADDIKIKIYRLYPELGNPPRIPGSEFDVGKFRAVYFEVEAERNAAGSSGGHAKLFQGQLLLIPSGS